MIYEGRPLARLPEWRDDLGIWQEYRKQMEAFYDDHFGFREPLIAFDLMIKRALFAETDPNVLPGREGWLYLKRDCNIDAINDFIGVTKFSRRQLKDIQVRLENRRDWLAGQGIKYLRPLKKAV